jgi:hypothetical protein
MTNLNEKISPIKGFSITDVSHLSIVELIMLQILLRHGRAVIRHNLYNEVSQFLESEKKKVASSINFKDLTPSGQKFYKFIQSKKRFSSSSLYNNLENLEKKGLVKFNRINEKVESVEATEYTEMLNTNVLKYIIKTGLLLVEQNRLLPEIIKKIGELIGSKKYGTMLFIWFDNFINYESINISSSITDNLFILSKKEVFDTIEKYGIKNIQHTSLFNDTIRESDNFFDAVVIPYHYRNANLYSMNKKTILEEAIRITKNDGKVIIHSFIDFPKIEHPFFNIFLRQVKEVYTEVIFYTEEEFRKELVDAGAKNIEIIEEKGHLYGIGKK